MKLDDLTAADVEKIFELYATHFYGRQDKDLLGKIYWSRELDATFNISKKRGTKVLECLAQSPLHGHEYRFGSMYSPHSKLVIDFNPSTKDVRAYFFDNLGELKSTGRKKAFVREVRATTEKFNAAILNYFRSREHDIEVIK